MRSYLEKGFVDNQVKMGSLEWALVQYAYVLIKRRNLGTERDISKGEKILKHKEDGIYGPRNARGYWKLRERFE